MAKDFSSVTEIAGHPVTQDQLDRAYSRYMFASEFTRGKDVLEVACGTGVGLGLMSAQRVIAGDITFDFVKRVGSNAAQLDAQFLPFGSSRFDIVILFEAIYYLPDARRFVREAYRVLRPGGVILVASSNREWIDFNPSPHSTRYYSCSELAELLSAERFHVESFVGFPAARGGLKGMVKRTAVKMKLMPKTMKGKELFKRIFVGKLKPFELRVGSADYQKPERIDPNQTPGKFRVLYALGRKSR